MMSPALRYTRTFTRSCVRLDEAAGVDYRFASPGGLIVPMIPKSQREKSDKVAAQTRPDSDLRLPARQEYTKTFVWCRLHEYQSDFASRKYPEVFGRF